MLKVKDLKTIIETIDQDNVDVVVKGDDGQVYDSCVKLEWYVVDGKKIPCLVIEKE